MKFSKNGECWEIDTLFGKSVGGGVGDLRGESYGDFSYETGQFAPPEVLTALVDEVDFLDVLEKFAPILEDCCDDDFEHCQKMIRAIQRAAAIDAIHAHFFECAKRILKGEK